MHVLNGPAVSFCSLLWELLITKLGSLFGIISFLSVSFFCNLDGAVAPQNSYQNAIHKRIEEKGKNKL